MTYRELIDWFEKAERWADMTINREQYVSYRNYKEDTDDMEIAIFENAHKLLFVNYTHSLAYPYDFEQVNDKLGVLSLDNEVFIFENGDYEYNQI